MLKQSLARLKKAAMEHKKEEESAEQEDQPQKSAEAETQRARTADSDSGISSISSSESSLTLQNPISVSDDVFAHGASREETSPSRPPSRLRFTGTNRGYLSVQRDQGSQAGWDLTIDQNSGCKEGNYKPYDFKSNHIWDPANEVSVIALENLYSSTISAESLFLCGSNGDSRWAVDIENTSKSETKTWWRSWTYPCLFLNCCSSEAPCKDCKDDSRVVLQYWGEGYQIKNPKSNDTNALFLVIEGGGSTQYQFCLRRKNIARCFGAFTWGDKTH